MKPDDMTPEQYEAISAAIDKAMRLLAHDWSVGHYGPDVPQDDACPWTST